MNAASEESSSNFLGKEIPDFVSPATGAHEFRLHAQRGHWLVLYFYPKDDTPGCTIEASEFRDLHNEFHLRHCKIYGVSRDTILSHEKFRKKFDLPFNLIADTNETIVKLFDVIKTKNMYGKKVRGIVRTTFLVDPQGFLRYEWRNLKALGHAQAVLTTLDQLIAA